MELTSQKFKILVIEDNEGDFILIDDYLNEKMHRPLVQQSGSYANASKLLADQKNDFDVILLDLSLPDISGEELLEKIMTLVVNTPIVVLTGYTQKDFGIKTLSMGVSDYLLKDEFTPTELYKSVLYSIERKRINAQLEKSEKKYRHIFHSSPLPMWVYELNTLRFLDVNKAAIKHYGYSKEEFLSMTIENIRPKEDLPKLREVLKNSENKDQFFFQGTFRHLKKSGELIDVDIQSNVIDFDGKRAEIILATDITEKIKAESQLKKSEAKLRKLNVELEEKVAARTAELVEKNEELELFNYAVSHELRAPLRFINFCLNSIAKQKAKQDLDEVFKIINDLSAACQKMYQQLEDLLAFSKVGKQALKPKHFNMESLIQKILKSLGQEYEINKYKIKIEPQPKAYGDENLLMYVLQNLLSNALKYSSKNSNPEINICVKERDKELEYTISDNGVGFDMKYYSSLFKNFERLHSDNEFAGNGAGLTIAQRVLKRHGGEIWAKGDEGKGAAFTFTLPKMTV